MSFVEKPPYGGNPSGKIGLLSGMYTRKAYRRQGLAKTLLDHVIEEARVYGCGTVQVTASATGSLLYADYGFEKSEKFMQIFLKKMAGCFERAVSCMLWHRSRRFQFSTITSEC